MSKFEIAMQRLDAAVEKIKNSEKVDIIFKDGRRTQGRMMCVFDCAPKHYVYMIFTDDSKTAAGLYRAYVAKFHILLGYGPDGDEEKMRIEFVDGPNSEEMKMINDVIKKSLSTGILARKPICEIQFGKVDEVGFY